MEINTITKEEAMAFLLNLDYLTKCKYKSVEDAKEYLDEGNYLGGFVDGKLVATVQWTLKAPKTAVLHGYVAKEHRAKAIDYYRRIMAILTKAGLTDLYIYCDKQVKNFTTRKLGFKLKDSIDDKYFLVYYKNTG